MGAAMCGRAPSPRLGAPFAHITRLLLWKFPLDNPALLAGRPIAAPRTSTHQHGQGFAPAQISPRGPDLRRDQETAAGDAELRVAGLADVVPVDLQGQWPIVCGADLQVLDA